MNKRRCSLQEFPYYPYCDQYKGETFDAGTLKRRNVSCVVHPTANLLFA